jgi:hypothetical protein
MTGLQRDSSQSCARYWPNRVLAADPREWLLRAAATVAVEGAWGVAAPLSNFAAGPPNDSRAKLRADRDRRRYAVGPHDRRLRYRAVIARKNIDVDRFIASLQALQVQPISADDWTGRIGRNVVFRTSWSACLMH